MFLNRLLASGFAIAAVVTPVANAIAADYAFGNVRVDAQLVEPNGRCPATVRLTGIFDVYRLHVGNYQWILSDGTKTGKAIYQVRTQTERTHTIIKDWVLESGSGAQTFWAKLCVASTYPQPLCSEPASFTVTCNGPAAGSATRGNGTMNVDAGMTATHALGANAGPRDDNRPAAAGAADPLFGKWDFTGRDSAGVTWRGTLTIGKPDPGRFDSARYNCICSLDVRSATSGKGIEAPCTYAPGTGTLSFKGGIFDAYSYTAVRSPDGKSLTQGKWSEYKKEDPLKNGHRVETESKTGTWSARSSGQ